jgi:hypothetical protein
MQLLFWLIVEITLECVGLDAIANYSEFVFKSDPVVEVFAKPAMLG